MQTKLLIANIPIQTLILALKLNINMVTSDSFQNNCTSHNNNLFKVDPDVVHKQNQVIKTLRLRVKELNRKVAAKNDIIKKLKSSQVESKDCKKSKRNWTKADIVRSLSLRAVSLKGYETVRSLHQDQ